MIFDLSRRSRSPIAQWWWTVDKIIIAHIIILMAIGAMLCLAATPTLALRLDLPLYYFVARHIIFFIPSAAIILGLSLLSPPRIKRVAVRLFILTLLGMIACLFIGPSVKGAHRWIYIYGFTIQPSEFIKPAFVVWSAHILTTQSGWSKYGFTLALYGLVVSVLLLQPDFGQTILITGILFTLFFISEAPLLLMGLFCMLSAALIGLCYILLPHVALRINSFLFPKNYDTYQTDRAIQAFSLGGLFGRGPGEGVVKKILPDAHTDFIFSVAAEEYGGIFTISLIVLFCILIIRGLMHALREEQLFLRVSIGGLVCLLGMQTCINLAVNVHLIPTKGMTLPLISYGGSSLLAISIVLGMILALTRKDASLHSFSS